MPCGALWRGGGGGGYQVAAGHCEREGSGFEQEASGSGAPPAPRQLAVSLDKANKYCPPRLIEILNCRAQPWTNLKKFCRWKLKRNFSEKQCSGSGVFGASRIRIRNYLYGSGNFQQQTKKLRKTLISNVL